MLPAVTYTGTWYFAVACNCWWVVDATEAVFQYSNAQHLPADRAASGQSIGG